MARKHKHEEHENHERWLVSYADFITLLFAFFVVMYSVSRVDNKRMVAAAQSIKWALHFAGNGGVGELPIFQGPPSNGGTVTGMGAGGAMTSERIKQIDQLKKRLEKRLKPYLLDKRVAQTVVVEVANGRLTVRLSASAFFDASDAALRPEALPVLDAIATELEATGRPVRVEAHTDDTSVGGKRFRNAWELSAARAATVTAYLQDAHRMDPALLTAAGRAAAHPLVPNDSPEHREMNRRVEMVVDLYSTDVGSRIAP
ncbi:MAG: flagellar motor protein MotB [Myxococcota bacterium]|jgi:chemotaxis protein MotB